MGWGRDVSLLADLHDAVVDNSVVTIKAAGGKSRRPQHYPRPEMKAEKEDTIAVPTIDDFPIHLVVALTQKK